MEIMISVILDCVLCALLGAMVFQCGVLAERHRELSYIVEKCRILSLDTQPARSTQERVAECACHKDTTAESQSVKPPEATETDFEGVKIWKPCQEKKPLESHQKHENE